MQRKQPKRSNDTLHSAALLAGIRVAHLDIATLRQFLHDLANCHDEKLDALRKKYKAMLTRFYVTNELASYRDELRLLWHRAEGMPHEDFEAFERWRKIRPTARPGEMICNRWLNCSETGLLAVWERDRRELIPSANDLPAILVYSCLFWDDHLCYCRNVRRTLVHWKPPWPIILLERMRVACKEGSEAQVVEKKPREKFPTTIATKREDKAMIHKPLYKQNEAVKQGRYYMARIPDFLLPGGRSQRVLIQIPIGVSGRAGSEIGSGEGTAEESPPADRVTDEPDYFRLADHPLGTSPLGCLRSAMGPLPKHEFLH